MPSALSKKIPPPPKQPGTHTNVEVKEALHARALRRTIVITAVLFMLFACLAVVSSTAQEYQGPENVTSTPKAIVIVTRALSPATALQARRSNNAPFSRLLTTTGGISGALKADYGDAADASAAGGTTTTTSLVHLLTGNASAMVGQSAMLDAAHGPSFLRTLKLAGGKPVLLAPRAYWSASTAGEDEVCSHVGLLDSECSGMRCPAADAAAYCNAHRKYLSCEAAAQLHRDEIGRGFAQTLADGGDLLYVQLDSFRGASNATSSVASEIELLSLLNLLDASLGKIALALSERTNTTKENWLLMVVGDGDNAAKEAPFGFAVYSRGGLVQLNAMPSEARTTDVYPTLLRWFGQTLTTEQQARVLGICSDGIHVANCPSATPTSAPGNK